jgi:hypothetical protein
LWAIAQVQKQREAAAEIENEEPLVDVDSPPKVSKQQTSLTPDLIEISHQMV